MQYFLGGAFYAVTLTTELILLLFHLLDLFFQSFNNSLFQP